MPDSDIQRLVERIEGATADSAERDELGVAINEALGIASYITDVGDPTQSVDAAMTLVPEGAGLSIQRYWIGAVDGPVWSAGISTGGIPSNPRQVFECYDAASAALAITAASLRARITERTDDE